MNNILVTGANDQLGSELKDIASNFTDYNFLLRIEQNNKLLQEIDLS